MEVVVLPVLPPPSHMAQAALRVLAVWSGIPEIHSPSLLKPKSANGVQNLALFSM